VVCQHCLGANWEAPLGGPGSFGEDVAPFLRKDIAARCAVVEESGADLG
jgi:hypothetical protein